MVVVVVVVVVFLTDNNTTPTKVVLSCFGLLVGLWQIPNYNTVTKICRLCIREKFNIVMNPHLATLNSRQEIFAHCRHKEPKLIGKPPD